MRCPKCGFTGFDHLPHCKKCAHPLRGTVKGAPNEPPRQSAAKLSSAASPPPPPGSSPKPLAAALPRPAQPSPSPPLATAAPLPELLAQVEPLPATRVAPPLPFADELPPLPSITLATGTRKKIPPPVQEAPFTLPLSGRSPGSASLLPPLDLSPSTGGATFTALPPLQEIPRGPQRPTPGGKTADD
jgi:hypothetical protein